MNAIRLLSAQHRAIESLFEDVANETRRSSRARAASRLTEELIAHMAAEENIFYPAARTALAHGAREAGPADPGRAPDEHFMLRAQLRRVLQTGIHTPAFTPRFEALRAIFAHHVDAEENGVFPTVGAALAPSRLDQLGVAIEGSRPRVWIVTTETNAALLAMHTPRDGAHGVRLPSLTEN
jgi:hemerythrin superfamily protein